MTRWWAAALILAAFAIGSARAQSGDDLDAVQKQIQQLTDVGKYVDALALQRRMAARIARAEIAASGRPGQKTVGALSGVAWQAVLSHDFKRALAVSVRAHALAADNLVVETNRAHALLFLGRVREARVIYFAYKNK